jgi:DNA-binding transcriptional ArsR family regulator
MYYAMPRAATTSDVFNAIAEPQRRRILALLRDGERSVNEVARSLQLAQPIASKHLRVLREVGLVQVRGEGRQRLYRLHAEGLKPVHMWTRGFAQWWQGSFDRLETYAQQLAREEAADEREQ